jgi:hypothetical protein
MRLEEEIARLSKESYALWKTRADKNQFDEVKADLEVYRLSGETVSSDPRRTPEYREKVLEGLGLGKEWREKHPALTEADVALRAGRFFPGRLLPFGWKEPPGRQSASSNMIRFLPVRLCARRHTIWVRKLPSGWMKSWRAKLLAANLFAVTPRGGVPRFLSEAMNLPTRRSGNAAW